MRNIHSMYRDIERWEVKVQIPGNKTEPQCPFLDTLRLAPVGAYV
jgi:hypothetical protein